MCQRRRVPLATRLFKPGRVRVGGEPGCCCFMFRGGAISAPSAPCHGQRPEQATPSSVTVHSAARCIPARAHRRGWPPCRMIFLDLISIRPPESLNRVVAAQGSRRDPVPPGGVLLYGLVRLWPSVRAWRGPHATERRRIRRLEAQGLLRLCTDGLLGEEGGWKNSAMPGRALSAACIPGSVPLRFRCALSPLIDRLCMEATCPGPSFSLVGDRFVQCCLDRARVWKEESEG